LSHLAVSEVPEVATERRIGEGMIPKVDSAVSAIESGVEKVQSVDGRIPFGLCWKFHRRGRCGTEAVL